MFINAKLNENMINKPNIRYSQTSLNSTQNSDLDYNLYCFSQGYENKEKGFWRGVLRNKNIDFDLKLDKEWNRRIELEDSLALSDAQSQISNLDTEIISIMNEGDMGWDKNLFQNFKKKQSGVKKQKNKEWLLSNGIKRAQGIVVELRTQNYKQFEENEKNKKLKKIQNEKPPQQKQELILDNSRYQYSEKAKKYNQAEYNQIKNYAGSDTKKTGASSTYNTLSDTKAYTKTVIKKNQYDVRSPLELSNKKYNKYQRSPRIEPMNNYGIKRQEIKIGQNYNNSNNITNKKKSDDQYVQAFTLDDRPKNLVRLEVSVEKKKKTSIERKPEPRQHDRVTSSKKKRKVSLDKYGKPITNTSRVNIDTSKKKAPKERLDNISRLEISAEKKKKTSIERKPEHRQHERVTSSKKKRKVSLDKYGKPLTNISRLDINTSKKKEQKERMENRSRLEISVEGKKKQKEGRKPSSRKHYRYSSSKKKRISVDSKGRPLTNTSRVNIDTSTKKAPKERVENRSRLEVSVGKKKQSTERKPESRKHSKIYMNKNKTSTYQTSENKYILKTEPKQSYTSQKIIQDNKYAQYKRIKPQTIQQEIKPVYQYQKRQDISSSKYTCQIQQPLNKTYLTDKKEKIVEQKPYVRKFDLGIKEDKSKTKRLQQTSYNQKLNRQSQLGNYETKIIEKAHNLGRLEVSAEKKKKTSIERKPEPRQHDRVTSCKKKRKVSLDKYGKPITNTSRVNIDTSKKKVPKERLDNISRLEISAEKKNKKSIERKPEPRQHERVTSSKKKRKVSLDKYGKPLTNTSRVNIDTSKKKAPKERMENRSRLEISVEGKKKQKEGRKPSSRKHYRYSSSKKKRISVDSQGRPLANTSRVNIDTSTKKAPKERVENRSRLEVSAEKKKQKEVRKTSSRKHSKIQIIKNNRKESLDKDGNPITNVNRLRVGIKQGRVKYAQLEDFDKYEDKSHVRHQTFQTDSNKYNKYNQTKQYKPQPQTKPQTQYTIIKTPIKQQENNNKNIIQHKRHLTEQISTQKLSEASKAFFTNKRQYERIKKDNQSNKETHKTQYSKGTESSYSYMKYGVSTAATNISEKKPRFDKGIDITKTSLFGQKDQTKTQSQTNRNYSYNKDFKGLITNKSYYNNTQREKPNTNGITKTNTNSNINKREKVVSENKTLDFSKYYKKYNEDKPKGNKKQTTYQKPIDNVNGKEIYEYIPTPKSEKYNNKNKNISQTQKKNQKEFSIDLTKYNGIFNKSNNKIQPQAIEVSEETRSSDNKRNKSTVPNNRFSFSQKPNSLVYFKLQFLNTKQVVEKFWNSIDNGELSISMFADNLRNSSKLSNFVSPEKNRMSKISTSSKLGKKINFSNTSELMSGRIRQSYKA